MPIPPPTSDDLERDAFLVGLRCNGYQRIDPALIRELLAHPMAAYVKAGANAVVHAAEPGLIVLLVETYERRHRAWMETKKPDASLSTMVASLNAMHQVLPDLYHAAANDADDTMLAAFGLMAMQQMNHPLTAATARQLLTDSRDFVRSIAADTLARVTPTSAYDDLLAQLNRPNIDKTIAPTLSALLSTGHAGAVDAAAAFLAKQSDAVKVACAYDMAIRRPPGAGQVVVGMLSDMKSEPNRTALLGALTTLGDSEAEACLFDSLRRGSDAEAITVIDRLAGYERRAGWHNDLRAAAKQRGDAAIVTQLETRIAQAKERDEMR